MRIFDCFLYNGEIEALELRLHELNDVVDAFVIVEATRTFSGNAKKLTFPTQRANLSASAGKIRYIAIEDDIARVKLDAGPLVEARVADAPRANEIVVAVVVTDSGRPLARVGGLQIHEVKGEDGLR